MKTKAFTLVELLISAAILSLVVLSLYSAFSTGLISYDKIDSAFSLFQGSNLALGRMQKDLQNTALYSADMNSNLTFKGSEKSLDSFFGLIDVYQKGKALTQLSRVSYSLDDGILVRRVYPGLNATRDDFEAEPQALLKNVKDISFEYASASEKEKTLTWASAWPPQNEGGGTGENDKASLPLFVKINLVLFQKDRHGDESGIVNLTKVVPLPQNE